MICPRCSVAAISATTGVCELCGYVPNGSVAVDAAQPNPVDELARAQLAHRFRIDVLLGVGPSSAVYLAREQDSSRHIVLKVHPRVPGRPDLVTRFWDAIAAARALDHPHLVPVLRNGETDSLLWFTTEHRRARTLKEMLRGGGPMDFKSALRLVTQIGAALDYLHRRGVVHGRLKPENVLVDAEGWVFICDTLVARAYHAGPIAVSPPQGPPRTSAPGAPAPRTSGAVFTPRVSDPKTPRRPSGSSEAQTGMPELPFRNPYSPPEEVTGILGASSDQYSLAAMLYAMLAGAAPHQDAGNHPPGALRPTIPPHVEMAIMRGLSERPNDRFPSVLDFVTALESAGSHVREARPTGRASDVILTIPGWTPPEVDTPWRKPIFIGGGVVLAILAAVAVIMTAGSKRPPIEAPFEEPQTASRAPADTTPSLTFSAAPSGSPRVSAPARVRLGEGRDAFQNPGNRSPDQRGSRRGRGAGDTAAATAAPAAAPPAAPSAVPAPPTAPAAAAGGGTLFVNATPWGQLFVDGQLVGNTPKANLAVTAGNHTIRVVRDGFNPVERTVHVNAGDVVRVTDIILTPHQ